MKVRYALFDLVRVSTDVPHTETIVTCFPHRQYDRDNEDLDAADKTDVLKTLVTYLHSPRRPEIDTSHALAELIFCQCVGILHRADMIPEVDFLKNYSVQSNIWVRIQIQPIILHNFSLINLGRRRDENAIRICLRL
jgi:hypothetical protein